MSVRRRRLSASHAARCTAGSSGMVSKPKHERRVYWLALLGGFPAVALALGLLWFGDFTPRTQWTLTIVVAGVWLACATIVREHVVRPLQTVSNVLAALRERDYTLRARGSNPEDALGDRKSTRLNSSHLVISYAVFCLKKKNKKTKI